MFAGQRAVLHVRADGRGDGDVSRFFTNWAAFSRNLLRVKTVDSTSRGCAVQVPIAAGTEGTVVHFVVVSMCEELSAVRHAEEIGDRAWPWVFTDRAALPVRDIVVLAL